MSSLCRDHKPGTWRILYVDTDGRRRTLRLGKMAHRTAQAIQRHVDVLLAARISGQPIPRETAAWLNGIGQPLRRKLARLGLVDATPNLPTLGEWLRDYVKSRTQVKPATRVAWGHAIRNLLEFFGEDRRIDLITPRDADRFAEYLRSCGLRPATVGRRILLARQFFRAAVRARFIMENPFTDVKSHPQVNPARQRFISREVIDRILAQCPTPHWQLLVALARYGGLRCPSEILSLKWDDIDWENRRIRVTCHKTQHHPGREFRIVPIFPEILPYLERVFELAQPGDAYVFPEYMRRRAKGPRGWANCNLRTQLARIIHRAGLEPWPRLFQNLRASCETELAEVFPAHVVAAWLGNTPRVAERHYLQVTEEHFQAAIRGVTGAQKAAQ